ncbi:Pkinase-domain-containing protein [Ceratobasidium sp. AG-I]|nr:Pkinase-domain-containing protein [Ceratobasidium sp. AG-I]
MAAVTASPPRLQKLPYHAWPTRFEKEQQAAGKDLGKQANDLASIGPWILGDMIGKGSSGRVKLGKHKYSGKIAAIKIISKNAALTSKTTINGMDAKHQKALQGIHREIVIMKLINHPCIMALYDLQETENEFYLALEYVEGGELFDYLVSRGRLAEPEALNYFKQILFGLDYCHRFNISHRDLKPENILLDKNMNIKIADFGMAALEVANGMLETSCGSPHYASPEIVAGKAYHGASSDIWSCGVVLYALLTGRLPFDHPNIRTLLQKVKAGKFRMHECLSPCAQDLIGRMLVVDPEERITIPQIFKHPFFLGPTNTIFINPAPPTLEDLSQPIGPYERVESAYLDNLLILFHTSRAELEKALRVRDAPNWEKAFLYLLRMYAERVRENYGEEDDEESVSGEFLVYSLPTSR